MSKTEKRIELLLCGLLSLLFSCAFFFGALFPEYGVLPGSVYTTSQLSGEKTEQEITDFETIDINQLRKIMHSHEDDTIEIRYYFYDEIKAGRSF